MKLGMINDWNEAGFATNAKLGLEAIEFCINGNINSAEVLADAENLKAYSEKYNVAVTSIGRWGMRRLDENGEAIPEAVQHDKNLIDLASILGCPVFNMGVNRVDGISYYDNCQLAIKYIAELLNYANGKNVKIAIYNCDWDNFIYDEKAWSIILGALPEVGIKYDSSHCINRRGNYLREIREWGKRIYHFHAKGLLIINNETVDDPPVGLDSLNWGEIMSLLYISGYNATVSIEPHSNRWNGDVKDWGTQFSVNFMRKYIMPDGYKF